LRLRNPAIIEPRTAPKRISDELIAISNSLLESHCKAEAMQNWLEVNIPIEYPKIKKLMFNINALFQTLVSFKDLELAIYTLLT